LLTAKPYSC